MWFQIEHFIILDFNIHFSVINWREVWWTNHQKLTSSVKSKGSSDGMRPVPKKTSTSMKLSRHWSKRYRVCYYDQMQPPRLFSTKISVLFFQEHLFLDFGRKLHVFTEYICSLNRYQILPGELLVYRTDSDFQEHSFWLPNRNWFSRSSFLATEQIIFFFILEYQRSTDRQFSGMYSPPNRYFSNRSRWLPSYDCVIIVKINNNYDSFDSGTTLLATAFIIHKNYFSWRLFWVVGIYEPNS